VLSLDFGPKAVDTSASSQEIIFTARLTDDLSGVTDGNIGGKGASPSQARFQSPSGNQISDVLFVPPGDLISGDEFNGTYQSKMTLPKYSEQGTWKLQYFLLADDVGNAKWLTQNDMNNLGFPTEFEVESSGDVEPPEVLSFNFDPKSIDTSVSSQDIIFTTHLTDCLSGVTDGDIGGKGVSPSQVRFQSPSGNQISDVLFVPPGDLISGDEFNGTYQNKMTLPKYSEQGMWKLQYFLLVDDVGNAKWLTQDDMNNLGFPTEFEVESSGDVEPPEVLSFNFDSKSIDTSASSQDIIFTTHLTDDLSGVTDGDIGGKGVSPSQVRFQSPSGNQISDVLFVPPDDLISGDELNGTYQNKMTLPKYSEQGTWKLQYFLLADDVGNAKWLTKDDMNNLGFPTTLRNGHSGSLSISGMKFNDTDNNTIKDGDESGLPGWSIELLLDGEVIDFIETDLDGTYSFDYLAPSNYTVQEVKQAGWVQTYPLGGSHSITLKDADSVGNDFGNHKIKQVDTKPPEIVSFDFNPKVIDAWNSSQMITVTSNISDDLSGFASSEIRFFSPSGDQYIDNKPLFTPIDPPSMQSASGRVETCDTELRVPQYSEKGTWELSHLILVDRAGNEAHMEKDDLMEMGFPTEFEVVSEGDKKPPNILSFDINPKLIDTSNSSQTVTLTAHLTDDLSGLGSATTCITRPSKWLTCCYGGGGLRPEPDYYTYELELEYPQGSEEGTWEIASFNFSDAVGNRRDLSKEDLETLGFPSGFRNLPPDKRIPGLAIEKRASSSIAAPNDLLNYTIIYTNTGDICLSEVVITESYPEGVEFISASPAPDPGTNNRWTIGDLPVAATGKIIVTVRVSEQQDLEFSRDGDISGEGFVNVRGSLSTSKRPLDLKNTVTINSAETGPVSASASVNVADSGTELETREHGSGLYDSEETLKLLTENKSIEMNKDVSATYAPTTLGLYRNRSVAFSSRWTEEARAKNRITGASMSESYRHAAFIDGESRIFLDENQSVMEIDSTFEGMGHFGFLKMPSSSDRHKTPLFEATEDYTGSFKVVENVDEYGLGVSSEKAASGAGLVVVDKRVGESQRSYESGAGSYDSEELIETYTSYIAKDISVVNAPMNQSLTGDVSINSSMKWKEGMRSKVPGTSYIGEEYTSITELDKETVAKGLNEMDTLANFSGQARYRAILKDEVDFDEAYSGDYSVERRVMFSGTAKYDRPHLNVTKTLDGIAEEKEDCDAYNCSKTKYIATYTISIENDGNAALGPIYVKDLFPPGSIFDEPSSLRPIELTETSANWTLTHLAIGDVATIILKLDVTKYYPDELVNRVEVCGGYGDSWVCASNFSSLELNWLSCCLDETVSVTKTAEVDDVNSNVVWYRIDITNNDNVTRAATVTDHLPEGMVLLDSMVSFASYNGSTITWNLIEIGPFERVTIPYRVSAQHPGRFVNSVLVDARSVDGPVVQPVRASSVIEVGEPAECESTACGLWSRPNWEFEYVGSYAGDLTCGDLS